MSTFTIPSASALTSAISSVCATIYAPSAPVGLHVRQVFKDRQVQLPPLASYDSQVAGLRSALEANPTLFSSTSEFNAFLSNVLWESICLSTLTESCTTSCADPVYYGRGYIQLTGRSNYEAFAAFANRPEIIQNPDLLASDQSLAWQSALFFWNNGSGCKGSTNAGQALICINRPECTASSSQSSVYFQFAPYYRLSMNQMLASSSSLSPSDVANAARAVCPSMQLSEGQAWSDFCAYHGNSSSPTICQNPLSISALSTTQLPSVTSTVTSSSTTSASESTPAKNAARAKQPRIIVYLLSAMAFLLSSSF